MKIFRNNIEIHNIEVDLQTELRQSIGGEDLISSRFTVAEKLDLQIGDFIEFKDSTYTILDEPQITKAQGTFTYTVEFKSNQYLLKNVQVRLDNQSEFHLYGNANDIVSLIISNLNRVYTDGDYYLDFVEPNTDSINFSFNNDNCLAALQRAAREFECEFMVKGKRITFKKKLGGETDLIFRYAKELQSIERQTLQNAQLVTVLYASGSQRNITNEYGSNRLAIPKIEKNVRVFGVIEKSITFDEVYPRHRGNVSTSPNPDEITDTGIDFDINDQLLEGQAAKVVFNTGDLSGREYEIGSYNHNAKKFELIPYTDETDLTTPNETLKPRVGDKYVLVNIKMPQAYINAAEDELLEKAQEYLDKFSQPNVIYKIAPHYPTLRNLNLDLNLGDSVTIQDDDFQIEFQTRIMSLRQKVASPFEYTIELGNQTTVNYLSKVVREQRDIKNNIYQNNKYITEQFDRSKRNAQEFSRAVHINRGPFNPEEFYYNSKNRIDYVYRITQDDTKEWFLFRGEDHTKGAWVENHWERIEGSFEIIATDTLLSEKANIGRWIMQEGRIVSQAAYDDETPRVQMDGENGLIELVSQVPAYNEQALQRMTIDSRTGRISAGREATRNQPPAFAELSSEGIVANTAGRDALSATMGVTARGSMVGLGRGRLERDFANSPYHFLAGVIGRSSNDDAAGAPAYGGAFWGLKSFGRYKGVHRIRASERSYTVKDSDEVLTCYNTGTLTIALPDNPPEGRTILIKRMDALVDVRCPGKVFTNVVQDNKNIKAGDIWQFIFDGNYWIANYQGRSDG